MARKNRWDDGQILGEKVREVQRGKSSRGETRRERERVRVNERRYNKIIAHEHLKMGDKKQRNYIECEIKEREREREFERMIRVMS